MEGAPDAKPGREGKPPPVPPNYVSLRQLQELRLKEKEEQERRRREEEEAAAAAAAKREAEKAAMAAAIKREAALKAGQERRRREEEEAAAAKREAKKAAMAAAIKREAALKAEAKGRAGSWEASGGAKETYRWGRPQGQGQGNQWVAVSHRAPATTVQPMPRGQGAAGKRGAAIGSGDGEKGPDDVPANASHGGGKPLVKKKGEGKGKGKGKGKSKEKLGEGALASSHGGGKPDEVVPASSDGGKPENRSESKAKGKGPGGQAGESSSRGEAAIFSSPRNRSRPLRREVIRADARSAETCTGIAMAKAAGPSPERGVKPDAMEKPEPPAPRRADAVAGIDSPDAEKAAPPTSAADVSSKPASGGDLREEAKTGDLVEGQRRRPMVEAVAELNPRVARYSAGPLSSRHKFAGEQRGRVWVAKTDAAAVAGSSAGAGP